MPGSMGGWFDWRPRAAQRKAEQERAERKQAAKWEIRWQDSDREESAVGRMYAAYRDTALALASAIRALKEEKK